MSEYVIEAYIDVPAQDCTNGYGLPNGNKVEAFHDCNRVGFQAESMDEAMAMAVVRALKQWGDKAGAADRFSLSVKSKHGPPSWKIEVDHGY